MNQRIAALNEAAEFLGDCLCWYMYRDQKEYINGWDCLSAVHRLMEIPEKFLDETAAEEQLVKLWDKVSSSGRRPSWEILFEWDNEVIAMYEAGLIPFELQVIAIFCIRDMLEKGEPITGEVHRGYQPEEASTCSKVYALIGKDKIREIAELALSVAGSKGYESVRSVLEEKYHGEPWYH